MYKGLYIIIIANQLNKLLNTFVSQAATKSLFTLDKINVRSYINKPKRITPCQKNLSQIFYRTNLSPGL